MGECCNERWQRLEGEEGVTGGLVLSTDPIREALGRGGSLRASRACGRSAARGGCLMRVGWGPAPHPGLCASGEPALSMSGDLVSSVGGNGGWGWRRCWAEVHRGCSQPGWSLQPWQGAGAAPSCCQELCLHFGVRTADLSPCIIACCLADTSAYLSSSSYLIAE